jgi:GntR family transcriptional regulator
MRFWIAKRNGVPVREQLVRQVVHGVLSGDLPVGKRLPGARVLARIHGIHVNTVASAYQELQERGVVEARRRSGLFVRRGEKDIVGRQRVAALLKAAWEAARLQGMSGDELAALLGKLVAGFRRNRVVAVDSEAELAAILVGLCCPARASATLRIFNSTPTPAKRAAQTVTIATASGLFRRGARAVLAGVGIDPLSLRDLDTREAGWRERLDPRGLLIADVVTAQALAELPGMRVFRVISDASLEELCLAVG